MRSSLRPARRSPSSAALVELVRAVVERGGHLEIGAVGTSMAPAIRPGDVLQVGPLRADEPRPGQVAIWSRAGRLVAHRVVQRAGEALVTRGDACDRDDPPVTTAEVIAVVRRVRSPWMARLRRALSARAAATPDLR
jgi:hypothetical protein